MTDSVAGTDPIPSASLALLAGSARTRWAGQVTDRLTALGARIDHRYPRVIRAGVRVRALGARTFVVDRRLVSGWVGISGGLTAAAAWRSRWARRRAGLVFGAAASGSWAVLLGADRLRWWRRPVRVRIGEGPAARIAAEEVRRLGYVVDLDARGGYVAQVPTGRVRSVVAALDDLHHAHATTPTPADRAGEGITPASG